MLVSARPSFAWNQWRIYVYLGKGRDFGPALSRSPQGVLRRDVVIRDRAGEARRPAGESATAHIHRVDAGLNVLVLFRSPGALLEEHTAAVLRPGDVLLDSMVVGHLLRRLRGCACGLDGVDLE